MSSFYQSIISIISKPQENREADEINLILNWFLNLFKKKSSVFGDIDADVVRDIIKNCSFETKKPDDVIIRQGDIGDCFYINLRGKVSIYLNHKNHEESDTVEDLNLSLNSTEELDSSHLNDASQSFTDLSFTMSPQEKSRLLRDKLGNYITSLGAGEGFGEIALVSENTRTATIIADEVTDLMVVNKALYARCLQAPAQRKLNEKQSFINNSQFFGSWPPKMKKLLSLCLERDVIPYDSYLQRQGEATDKIYFMISGEAKVSANPSSHSVQYPRLYPLKLPENAEKDIISSWIDEKNAILNNSGTKPAVQPRSIHQNKLFQNSQAIKRRTETFAEAEQRRKTKNLEIGIVGPGEIAGLAEVLFELPTYMQSIRCLEDCDVFYIYKRSYDRLISKRNPVCVNRMKEHVYIKLMSRNNRLMNKIPIDLYRSLQYRIELGRQKRSMIPIKKRSSNLSDMAIKGPIIQFDTKPKLAEYNRLTRRKKLLNNKSENEELKYAWVTENINKLNDTRDLVSQQTIKTETSDSVMGSCDSYQDNHSLPISGNSELGLEHLENRIKQWHLDAGSKRIVVPKLNRIDVDKIKTDIKVGGNIFIRKHSQVNDNSHKTSRMRTTSGYSDTSSSENNCSDSEHFQSNPDALKLNLNSSTSENHLVPSPPSLSYNLLATLPSNENKSTFISNFLAYISSDSNNESSCSIEANEPNLNNRTDYADPLAPNEQSFCESNSVPVLRKQSDPTSNFSKAFNLPRKRGSLQANKLHESVYESQEQLNNEAPFDQSAATNNNSSGDSFRYDSLTEMIVLPDKSCRKKSLPNITFRNHRPSMQVFNQTPYMFKKRLSLGQVKIQHTGKKYTKEEYEALKTKLKFESKRFIAYTITSRV